MHIPMYLNLAVTICLLVDISNGFAENRFSDKEGPAVVTAETRLHNDLFYIKRESHPTNGVLDVTFGLTLISVVDYDGTGESIIINAYIRQKWQNPVTIWDPKYYGGITQINVRPEKTWVPDIYAYDDVEAQFKYNGLMSTLKTNIIVSYDGGHAWLAPIIMKLGCGMNVRDFPFDTQKCPLLFGSFTHDKTKLNLIPENVNMSKYSESSEWAFKSMNHTKNDVLYPGSEFEFSTVIYTVVLQRKPLYHVINLLAPTLILTFLALLVFIQPVTAGERCVYVITIVVALSWFVTSAFDYLPTSSEGVSLSQVFLSMSLSVIVLLSLFLCYSIGIHYGNLGTSEMPTFLRKYVLGKLGTYFRCNIRREYPLWRKYLKVIKEAEARLNYADSERSYDNVSDDEKIEDLFPHQPVSDSTSLHSSEESLSSKLENLLGVQNIHLVNTRLQMLLDKLEDEDDNKWIEREWKALAVALDYLFLYFFTSILILTLMYCGVVVLFLS